MQKCKRQIQLNADIIIQIIPYYFLPGYFLLLSTLPPSLPNEIKLSNIGPGVKQTVGISYTVNRF